MSEDRLLFAAQHFNYRIVKTHFASILTWNNPELIAETRGVTFSDDVLALFAQTHLGA